MMPRICTCFFRSAESVRAGGFLQNRIQPASIRVKGQMARSSRQGQALPCAADRALIVANIDSEPRSTVIFFAQYCSKTAIETWPNTWHKELTREGLMSLVLQCTHPSVPLDRHTLLTAFRTMNTIREFEERLHVEFATGEVPGFVHLYAGEEAIATGVCMHLSDVDRIASTHRGHGHCIAKGCDLKGMAAEIYGKRTGICGGKGGSMHIADLSRGMMGANGIVGGGPPLICGAGLAAKKLGTKNVAVAFFGDGASNQGTTFESYNLAKVWNLP